MVIKWYSNGSHIPERKPTIAKGLTFLTNFIENMFCSERENRSQTRSLRVCFLNCETEVL